MNENKLKQQYDLLGQEVGELEDYIKDIWEFVPVPLAYINPVGIILDVDKALEDFLGRPREDIIGEPLKEMGDELASLHAETLKNGQVVGKIVSLIGPENKLITASVSSLIRKDTAGDTVGYFVSLIDQTETKKIQNKLEDHVAELKEFHDLAVGRELKMIELEKELERLKKEGE